LFTWVNFGEKIDLASSGAFSAGSGTGVGNGASETYKKWAGNCLRVPTPDTRAVLVHPWCRITSKWTPAKMPESVHYW
jgi:hypothetical protein